MTNRSIRKTMLFYLEDAYVEEFYRMDAVPRSHSTSQRFILSPRRRVALIALSLSLCLLLTVIPVMHRLDYHPFLASCSGSIGEIVLGDYYYFVPHRGVYCYDPESNASRLVLHTYWADEYVVHSGGVFYERGLSAYWCDSNGERQRVYTANPLETTHIALNTMTTGEVAITCYNKHNQTLYQVILHGMRGVIQGKTEEQSYKEIKLSEACHSIGERRGIVLVQTDARNNWLLDIHENGASLLPDGATVSKYRVLQAGWSLWFTIYYEDQTHDGFADYLVLDANGDTRIVTLPDQPYVGGDAAYLFYPTYDNGVGCVEIATGESWVLTSEGDTTNVYDIATDGTYLYASAPWSEQQSAWRIERDHTGKPVGITLLNPNLSGK